MKKRIDKKRIVRYLGVLAVVEPTYISEMIRSIHYIWRLLYYFCILFLLLEIYGSGITKTVLKDMFFPVLIYSFIVLSSIYNGGLVKDSFLRLLTYSYCFTLISILREKNELSDALNIIRNVLFVLVAINFLSVVIFPNGMYQRVKTDNSIDTRYWFLGFKNGIGKNCVIACALCFANNFQNNNCKNRFFAALTVLFSIATTVLIGSGSGIVGTMLVTSLYCVVKLKYAGGLNKQGLLRIRNLALIVVFLFVSIVLSDFLLTSELTQQFIVGILGKTVTLTGRTAIWHNVIELIKRNWLTGIGMSPGELIIELIAIGPHATDAHNFYLEFFLEGGIVCFVLLVLFLWKVVYRLDKNRKDLVSVALSAGLFSLLVIFLVENCNNAFLWFYFGLCMNCKGLTQEKKVIFKIF